MNIKDMRATARALVALGEGILAADESVGTLEKRFRVMHIEATEENRRAYRELLFTTAGLGEFISGVILFDETIRQRASDGRTFVDILRAQGIIPGIKVDRGAKAMAGHAGEKVTEGLDGLRERLAAYAELGALFVKWRAVITVGTGIPTRACIVANAHGLARYAALSQEAGLVPIVEPEVLMDGDHSIERHAAVTEETLHRVFDALFEHRVRFEAMLLKPNMVLSGKDAVTQAGTQQVAEATLRCMMNAVPAAVPGIVFLSGGQSARQATDNLNRINQIAMAPWELSFSFGRALQEPVLKAWNGRAENACEAQKALLHRARCNGAARFGNYRAEMEGMRETPVCCAVA